MAKAHWLINSKKTEVKRFIRNDKSIEGVFEYMFVDTGKIVGVFGKEPPVMTTTVSIDIPHASPGSSFIFSISLSLLLFSLYDFLVLPCALFQNISFWLYL